MGFRSFRIHVRPGHARQVLKAAQEDVQVEIRSSSLPGQLQAGLGYNFAVGGPELEEDPSLGLYCFDSTWDSGAFALEEGDEIWVAVLDGQAPWTEGAVPLTVLVRTHSQPHLLPGLAGMKREKQPQQRGGRA